MLSRVSVWTTCGLILWTRTLEATFLPSQHSAERKSNTVYIQNVHSGLVASVENGNILAGTSVVTTAPHGKLHQLWVMTSGNVMSALNGLLLTAWSEGESCDGSPVLMMPRASTNRWDDASFAVSSGQVWRLANDSTLITTGGCVLSTSPSATYGVEREEKDERDERDASLKWGLVTSTPDGSDSQKWRLLTSESTVKQ